MPLDALFIKHLATELNEELTKSSIKRIYNISNNEFLFKLQNKKQLYISVNNECRVNITSKDFIFPEKPSNFTMVLRKYLKTFKITDISSYCKDRIIKITFSGLNELKDYVTYHLYVELFNRYSNIILTTEDNTIINALKLVNNEQRTVLANYRYLVEEQETYYSKFNIPCDFQLLPCTTSKDFYFTNVFDTPVTTYQTLSQLLDNFYFDRDKQRRVNYLVKNCSSAINSEVKKLERKLVKLDKDYQANSEYDIYKLYGDLILTYGYQNQKKDLLVCNDYQGNSVTIKLDETLDVSSNANLYYNKYSKLKRSLDHIQTQKTVANERLTYLNNLLFQISISNEQELVEIANEFNNLASKNKQAKSTITKISNDDFTIYIGKNNLQNEEITFKLSRKDDLWFHIKDLPGSHVLLKANNPTDEIIKYTAQIAAYYSKGSNYPKVDVMYTNVKNVKKVSHSYPGHVSIINDFKVINVVPTKENES